MSYRMTRRALTGLLASLCAVAVTAPAPSYAQGAKPGPAARPIKNTVPGTAQRHQAILQRAKQGNIDLIFLGDSITQGWTAPGMGKSLFDARYLPIKGANFGVGSDQTNHALWRITTGGELKGLKPKLVVLMIGINNVTSTNQTGAQIAEGHAAIIKAIQSNHAGTKVLLVSTFPAGKLKGSKLKTKPRARVKAINAALAKLADGDKVRFLDIHDKFLDAKGELTDAISGDEIHLKAKGYQIWADAIQPMIDEVVGKAPVKPTPAGKRTRWVHAQGEVVLTSKGVWVEKFKTGTFNFVEKATTAEHVELYDKGRDYTVRLTATAMLIKGGKGNVPKFPTFTKQRDGKWDDAPSGPVNPSGKLAWGKKVSPAFRTKVVAIAREIGVSPSDLMACMAFESAETFRADIVNKSSGATGLIQFLPSTARGLGTTTDALKKMTPEQQLDYVRKYFLPKKGKLKNIDDLYMAILWPVAVGKADDYVLFSKDDKKTAQAYKLNAGLDRNKDGKVTKAEASAPPRAKLTKGMADSLASPMP